jgi:sugar phosphate permease
MLVAYILAWSASTAATGFVGGLLGLLLVRGVCGLAEAGAYPASARLLREWFPFAQRARASSVVAFGGRIGNSMALWLTAAAIAMLGSWRPVLWVYGAIGIGLAAATQVVFRDRPEDHPAVNAAERELIGTQEGAGAKEAARAPFPWRELVSHRGLWFLNVGSLGMNLGWAFLITWLPTYLQEVRGLDAVTSTRYVSLALFAALPGMLFGGLWCDFLTRRYGMVWGRRLPFLIGGGVAAGAYLMCPFLPSGLAVAAVCGVVSFAADSMIPAVWALAQDIGATHVASTLAWSNMWGNLGSSVVSKAIPLLLASAWHGADWREAFVVVALGFVLAGVCSLGIDSSRRLVGPAS